MARVLDRSSALFGNGQSALTIQLGQDSRATVSQSCQHRRSFDPLSALARGGILLRHWRVCTRWGAQTRQRCGRVGTHLFPGSPPLIVSSHTGLPITRASRQEPNTTNQVLRLPLLSPGQRTRPARMRPARQAVGRRSFGWTERGSRQSHEWVDRRRLASASRVLCSAHSLLTAPLALHTGLACCTPDLA